MDKTARRFLAAKIRETIASEIPTNGFENAMLQTEISRDLSSLSAERDPVLDRAFHLLMHFITDEDIRSKDTRYATSQIEALEKLASELEQ
ncbi:hypothetical protein [Edaphobacter aggregans]|uniref:hypothetical protein n=1 Tax=Edaphobacter aggregans TaxID=570835 RepID=UPI0005503B1B|nr:hypothetical protein [Edaphobacter aggregans]